MGKKDIPIPHYPSKCPFPSTLSQDPLSCPSHISCPSLNLHTVHCHGKLSYVRQFLDSIAFGILLDLYYVSLYSIYK